MEKKIVPYIKARCGEDNHEHYEKTDPIKSGTANPVWNPQQHNHLRLQRHPRDSGVLLIEVWDWDRWHADKFVGGARSMLRSSLAQPCGAHLTDWMRACVRRPHEWWQALVWI